MSPWGEVRPWEHVLLRDRKLTIMIQWCCPSVNYSYRELNRTMAMSCLEDSYRMSRQISWVWRVSSIHGPQLCSMTSWFCKGKRLAVVAEVAPGRGWLFWIAVLSPGFWKVILALLTILCFCLPAKPDFSCCPTLFVRSLWMVKHHGLIYLFYCSRELGCYRWILLNTYDTPRA